MNANELIHRTKNSARHLRRLQSVIGLLLLVTVAILISPEKRDGTNIFLGGNGPIEIVENFLAGESNLVNILRQVSEIGIMALGMTFVILTAGIDLSVGSVLALSASTVSLLLTRWDSGMSGTMHVTACIGVAVGLCAVVGFVVGAVIANLRLQPFVATLAAMIGIRGLAKWLTENTNIDIGFGGGTPAVFAETFSEKFLVIGVFVALALLLGILLSRTVFGRYVRALGDNAKAAVYAGLPTKRILIMVYMLSGALAGVAGVLHAAQEHQGSPNAGVAYELDVIAAVVIGGTSLAGGRGRIVGTIIGTLFMGVLTNILGLRNVDFNVQLMVKAVIIIAAVTLQQTRKQAA